MNCPLLTEVDDYLEKEITREKAKLLEEHFLTCPDCRQIVESRRRFLEACSRLPDLPLPFEWAKTVMAKISRLGSTFPTLIIIVMTSLSLFLSSMVTFVHYLKVQTPAASFISKLPLFDVTKAFILMLTKAIFLVASVGQSFLKLVNYLSPRPGWFLPCLAFEFATAVFLAIIISIISMFILINCYRHCLAKEKN